MIKVMLVDDESKVREAIRRLVPWEEMGISLIGNCSNAVEALHEMTEEMPDVLITDIKMPVMSGIELIAQAKAMYPLLQCVIISGYDEFPLAQAAMMEGVKHYLLKPCMKEDVIAVLQKCIEEIGKIKKAALSNLGNRNAIIEKLIIDMKNLPLEDGDAEGQIKQLMEYYGEDGSLLREAAVALIIRFWPVEAQQVAMNRIGKLFETQESLYLVVGQILLERKMLLSEDDSFVVKIKRYIDKYFDQSNLSLQYVADTVVNMDAKYVGRKFRQEMGIKFNDYLLKVRIEHAISMLSSANDYRLYEIAEGVGLGNNVQYFYQLFKKYTGMTPREYQEKMNG